MTRYLAGVLTVIALGTLLIAYGLLNPRIAAADAFSAARGYDSLRVPVSTDGATVLNNGLRSPIAQAYPIGERGNATNVPTIVRDSRVDSVRQTPVRATRVIQRAPTRDWKQTAMVIGGSSLAGAGLGGLIGGRKGALIGAAVGGGAATVYEMKR